MSAPTSAPDPANTPFGLTSAEAARRLAEVGPNRLPGMRRRRLPQILAGVLREPMFLLLLAAVAFYGALGDLAEASFLLAGALASIGLVVLQEARSERALAALKALAAPNALVRRDGAWRRIPAAELVPGDVVLVGEGGRLPADGLLVAGDVLSVDESLLTGESAPVTRQPSGGAEDAAQLQEGELWAGALVVRGSGVMEVGATGASTRFGGIGEMLRGGREPPTRLQQSSQRLIQRLGVAAALLAGATALANGFISGDWRDGVVTGLTLAIALIPEEFPMVLAVFLALGAGRLARRQVLVRRTAAVEALGDITVLCVDKTGTLTRNQMAVAAVWTRQAGRLAPTQPGAAALLEAGRDASAVTPLDPMDRALQAAAPTPMAGAPLWTDPLRPNRLAFVQAWAEPDGPRLAAKGAPEAIYDLCSLPDAERQAADLALADMAQAGLRVLGVALRRGDDDPSGGQALRPFHFMGLVGFEDPVREDAHAAVAAASAAGIQVVMITGDYPATALAIARMAGLDTAGGVLSGDQLAQMDEVALREAVRKVRVLARITPEQKVRIVRALQARGEQVGMFGDGVNDAPALQAAEVGIAMGQRGVEVAREAADIVLLDDRLASAIAGVEEGRRIFSNLQAVLVYLVVVHVPMAGLALLPPLLGVPPVLFPMQVVLLELVIDPMCALVFQARPAAHDIMRRPPRPATEPLARTADLARAAAAGGLVLAGALGAQLGLVAEGLPTPQGRGAALALLVCGNLAAAGVLSRAVTRRDGPWLLFAGIACAALSATLIALYLPWAKALFQVEAPPPALLLAVALVGIALGAVAGRLGRGKALRGGGSAAGGRPPLSGPRLPDRGL